ncbi:MAG: FimV/HubP family polar landmark protein, partial [Pseudomonadota bacterium]
TQITSQQPIKEPYLNFLIELNWANGRMVREYTVLLDPPLYDPVRKQQAATTAPQPLPPEPAPAVTEPLPAPRPSPPPSPPPVAEYSPPTYSGGETIGPVAANDTLWRLADAHRPADVSVQQMMMALFLANPEAFGSNNINVLKRGAILRMPTRDELASLSHTDAVQQAQQHHQAWNNYRQGAAQSVAEQPLGSDDIVADSSDSSSADAASADATGSDDARLELVAPDDSDSSGVGGGSDGNASLLQEQLDAKTQENAELLAKITEADEIIELMQRQVEIKDEELAALQARLQELGVEIAEATSATDAVDGGEIDDGMTDEPIAAVEDDVAEEEIADEQPAMDETEQEPTEEPIVEEPVAEDEAPAEDVTEVADTAETEAPAVEESPEAGGIIGFASKFIPPHIAEMMPGGVLGILAAIGVLLLLLIGWILKRLIGGREREMPTPSHEKAKVEALDETLADVDDDADATVNEFEKDTIEANAESISDSFEDTLEATSDDLQAAVEAPQAEEEEDPLEEVNVYLAYERFDQAEELVRKVIAENPDDPRLRLRLLEVFYSSNDQAAYEAEARNLLDAVGEDDPMWQSALAMWGEISPDRALFSEGGGELGAADTGSMKAFVDITSETEDSGLDMTGSGGETISMGPDAQGSLESTAVGLQELDDEVGPVDFNLSEDDDSIEVDGTVDLNLATTTDEELLDLTATDTADADVADTADLLDLGETQVEPEATADEMFDLTDTADAGDDVLDLTATADASDGDVLDLTATADASDGDVLDLTATTESPEASDTVFDLTADANDADDVLDLTATSDAPSDADELLELTTESAELDDITGDEIFDMTEKVDDDADSLIDITQAGVDLSLTDDDPLDLTTPADTNEADLLDVTKTGDLSGADDTDVLNVTSPGTLDGLNAEAEENTVDFDISETVADVFSDTSGNATDDDALNLTSDGTDDDTLDFEIGSLDDVADSSNIAEHPTVKLGASDEPASAADDTVDFDLSLQSTELDELTETSDDAPGEDAAIDFDLALEDTSDMDSIVVDETLELPKSSTEDESLEDLTKSMEDSMAELELDMDSSDKDLEASLDDEMDIDLDMDDTIGIEAGSDLAEEGDLEDVEQTLVLDGEGGGDASETDTKLNLAKAYIELGDTDGARSILDEVARDGTDEQKVEAQRLIDQIS